MPADLIAGRYRVGRALGKGAMGTVWLCTDELLNREVAVKQIGGFPGEASVENARAMREARSAAAVNHENAVSIFDVVDHDGTPWLVMEYVDGRTLAEAINEDGPLEPERVAVIGAELADALAQAHDLGIIHRDVKPANVMITTDGRAMISDFGIARHDQDEQLTQIGLMTGTPAYFAPELARGADPSRAADVYALGATLYTAVEGRTPYERESNPINMLRRIDTTSPRRVHHAGALRPALAGLMNPEPASRWTMREAVQRLSDIAEGRSPEGDAPTLVAPVPAPRQPDPLGDGQTPVQPRPVVPPPDQDRRGRGWLIAASILLLALLVGTGGYLLLANDDPEVAGDRPNDNPTRGATEAPSDQPNSSPSPSETQEPEEETPAPDEPASAAEREEFVQAYFTQLPEDTDAGWQQLSPEMQDDVGRDSYDEFWGSMTNVEVGNISAGPGQDAVTADVTYFFEDGRVVDETQRLDLVEQDGQLLIAGDEPLSSQTR